MSSSLKTFFKTGDDLAFGFSSSLSAVTKNIAGSFDMKTLFKSFDVSKFAVKMDFPTSGFKNSSYMFDTSSVAKYSAAIPQSTDEIASSLSKQSDLVVSTSVDIASDLDPKTLARIADGNSIESITKMTSDLAESSVDDIAGVTRKSADDILADTTVLKKVDGALLPVETIDDIPDVLRKGKGVSEVAETTVDASTTAAAKKSDDAVAAAKKITDVDAPDSVITKRLNQFRTFVEVGTLLYIFAGIYINNRTNPENEEEEDYDYIGPIVDPGSTVYENVINEIDGSNNVFDWSDLIQTKEFIIAIIIIIVIFFM